MNLLRAFDDAVNNRHFEYRVQGRIDSVSAEFRYNRPAPAPTGDLRQKINDQQQLIDLINDHFPALR